VAVGVPIWGDVGGGFDLWPPLYVALSLVAILSIAGRRVTARKLLMAVAAGTLWSWATDVVGVIPAAAWAVLLTAICGAAYRRARDRAGA
jgi:hypothetical protein